MRVLKFAFCPTNSKLFVRHLENKGWPWSSTEQFRVSNEMMRKMQKDMGNFVSSLILVSMITMLW